MTDAPVGPFACWRGPPSAPALGSKLPGEGETLFAVQAVGQSSAKEFSPLPPFHRTARIGNPPLTRQRRQPSCLPRTVPLKNFRCPDRFSCSRSKSQPCQAVPTVLSLKLRTPAKPHSHFAGQSSRKAQHRSTAVSHSRSKHLKSSSGKPFWQRKSRLHARTARPCPCQCAGPQPAPPAGHSECGTAGNTAQQGISPDPCRPDLGRPDRRKAREVPPCETNAMGVCYSFRLFLA